MSEIKVILAENPDDPMLTLRESLKKNGCQVAVCASGFDALDEVINSGANILVLTDNLPDITGFQLSCLLKSTIVTGSLPVVLISSNENDDSFWKRASLADSVLKRRQVEQSELDSVKLIKRLATLKSNAALTPEQIDAQPVISGSFGGNDLLRSFGGLLDGLLAERLVRHFTRRLSACVHDRAEFTTEFFDLISRLFRPDVSGIIVMAPSPWSVYHINKVINKDILETLIYNATTNLGLSAQAHAQFYGEAVDPRGARLQKARVLEINGINGAKLGAVLVGWTSDKDIDNVLKSALEHLRDQLVPVLQLLIEKDRYGMLEAQAQYWSMVDPISGLYNMEFFMGYLQQQLLFSQRQKLAVGLCIIDVDGFVGITAQYGSETGNLLLKTLSEKLSKCIRSSDLMARYSGDQFVVVLPNTDMAGTKILADKLRTEAEKLNPAEQTGRSPRVTISVGCAQFNQHDMAPEAIIKDAKDALLRAKEKGRNCVSE
ncbi:MAG: diguanylate cyclase [Candidatus Obscuribacterales bacterium]|nr:diguanylate cyclase [Candidatus Obscuribacterales bacterium]